MKVAHWVYDLIRGGSEGQCARTAMGLARRGWEQQVVVFHRRGFYLEAVEAACGRAWEVEIRHAARPGTVREVFRLARKLREAGVDVLHTWDADAAVFGQFAARLAGVRLVTSRRDLGAIYPRWKEALLRRADRQAVRVAANAKAVVEHFAAAGVPREKLALLPNLGPEAARDEAAEAEWARRLGEGRWMAVVNRLDPEKNTGLAVEALAMVLRRHPEARLVVAGDGREREGLERLAREKGTAGAVQFLGDVTGVASLLRACEIGALLPKANEGLSNTILEYMGAGLPVIASDCGGNRELVEEGACGILLEREPSAEAVAEAWRRLLEDPEGARRMGEAGRRHVERVYAPERALDAFEAFYRAVGGS